MSGPIVIVKQGKLQGVVQENVLGSKYYAFKGIPFAAPPLGQLRFKDPEPPASWDGIRDASQNGNLCFQIEPTTQMIIGSEDCLYLNVYVPSTIHGTTGNPVMIWIHGGAYLAGSGNDTVYRPDYLMKKDIIVVSINYRLGVFGFLNLGHETASGNQALKDQIAALKWVKENIEAFGGDPDNITISGISAGAACVHLLMLTPASKGLFHKAILQSGTATCCWAMKEDQSEANSFKLASIFGNDSKDPITVAEFLRTLRAEDLVKEQHHVLTAEAARIINIPFAPTSDKNAKNPLFPRSLSEMLDDDNDIPIILGYTSQEYIMFLRDISEATLQRIYENIPRYVEEFLGSTDPKRILPLTERVKKWYFNDKPCTKYSLPFVIKFLSDVYFNIPAKELADRRRKRNAPTYFYVFSYVGSEMVFTKYVDLPTATIAGASHSDDASYLFYKTKYKANEPEPPAMGTRDYKVMEALNSMWSNFAKSGNPTPVLDQNVTTTWLPATADALNYLDIDDSLQCAKITDYTNIFRETN